MAPRVFAAAALASVLAAGCAALPATPSPQSSATAVASPTAASPGPTSSPTPTATRLAIDSLTAATPRAALRGTTTGVCDGDPSLQQPESPASTVLCGDALLLGARVAISLTGHSPHRLFLSRPDCSTPCSTDELSTGTVHIWVGARQLDAVIDTRLPYVTISDPGTPAWPAPLGARTPPVARPHLPGAPSQLSRREALPYCGRTVGAADPTALACFRDAVVAARPAEMIQTPATGEVVWVFRFAGSGATLRYQRSDGAWRVGAGALVLHDGPSWDFDPWTGTEESLG